MKRKIVTVLFLLIMVFTVGCNKDKKNDPTPTPTTVPTATSTPTPVPDTSKLPKTGDASHLFLYAFVGCMSFAALTLLRRRVKA